MDQQTMVTLAKMGAAAALGIGAMGSALGCGTAGMAAINYALIRRRMEDYLAASVLMRCFVPVRSTRREYELLVSRTRLAMRSIRHILARV